MMSDVNLFVAAYIMHILVGVSAQDVCLSGGQKLFDCTYDTTVTHVQTYWRHSPDGTTFTDILYKAEGFDPYEYPNTGFDGRIQYTSLQPGNCGITFTNIMANDTGWFQVEVQLSGPIVTPQNTAIPPVDDTASEEILVKDNLLFHVDDVAYEYDSTPGVMLPRTTFEFVVDMTGACVPGAAITISFEGSNCDEPTMCPDVHLCGTNVTSTCAISIKIELSGGFSFSENISRDATTITTNIPTGNPTSMSNTPTDITSSTTQDVSAVTTQMTGHTDTSTVKEHPSITSTDPYDGTTAKTDESGLEIWIIILIVVAAIVIILAVGITIICCVRKNDNKTLKNDGNTGRKNNNVKKKHDVIPHGEHNMHDGTNKPGPGMSQSSPEMVRYLGAQSNTVPMHNAPMMLVSEGPRSTIPVGATPVVYDVRNPDKSIIHHGSYTNPAYVSGHDEPQPDY